MPMPNQIDLYKKNIDAVLVIDSVFKYMKSQVTAFDITELLRAEFVLIVGALDFYIHGVVRECLIEQFYKTDNCDDSTISIPLQTVKVLLHVKSEEEQIKILDQQIKNIISKDSYQAPRAVEKALGMINIKKVWSKVSEISGKSAEDIRNTLAIIINRRNKIAHEADIDFLTGEKTEITQFEIKECMDFVTMFIEAIDKIIEKS